MTTNEVGVVSNTLYPHSTKFYSVNNWFETYGIEVAPCSIVSVSSPGQSLCRSIWCSPGDWLSAASPGGWGQSRSCRWGPCQWPSITWSWSSSASRWSWSADPCYRLPHPWRPPSTTLSRCSVGPSHLWLPEGHFQGKRYSRDSSFLVEHSPPSSLATSTSSDL